MSTTTGTNGTGRQEKVLLRLVSARDRKPLTGNAPVGLRALSRRGAQLILDSPFIDGLHVLMDVHNTTPKLIQVSLPGENPETHQAVTLLGDIESYRREEDAGGACFVLEITWLDDEISPALHERDLKRLMRQLKKDPQSLGAR
jgi:hypothetical protein